jgi:hypothetical protein
MPKGSARARVDANTGIATPEARRAPSPRSAHAKSGQVQCLLVPRPPEGLPKASPCGRRSSTRPPMRGLVSRTEDASLLKVCALAYQNMFQRRIPSQGKRARKRNCEQGNGRELRVAKGWGPIVDNNRTLLPPSPHQQNVPALWPPN